MTNPKTIEEVVVEFENQFVEVIREGMFMGTRLMKGAPLGSINPDDISKFIRQSYAVLLSGISEQIEGKRQGYIKGVGRHEEISRQEYNLGVADAATIIKEAMGK